MCMLVLCCCVWVVVVVEAHMPTTDSKFMSVEQLGEVYEVLDEVHMALTNYLQVVEQSLEQARHLAQVMSDLKRHGPQVVSHPVGTLLLVRSLGQEWPQVVEALQTGVEQQSDHLHTQLLPTHTTAQHRLPTASDLAGVMTGVIRLQAVYQLESWELVETSLSPTLGVGGRFNLSLGVGECLQLARHAASTTTNLYAPTEGQNRGIKHHQLIAAIWYQQALNSLLITNSTDMTHLAQSLHGLARHVFLLGNADYASYLINWLLLIEPHHNLSPEELEMVGERGEFSHEGFHTINLQVKQQRVVPAYLVGPNESEDHAKILQAPYTESKLCLDSKEMRYPFKENARPGSYPRCYYHYGYKNQLLLSPMEVEEMSLDPAIHLYHHFARDDEVDEIVAMGRSTLEMSVVMHDNGSLTGDHLRISQNAWLSPDKVPAVGQLARRLSALTGLDMKSSEDLQVLNYGIGGLYASHHDYLKNDTTSWKEYGPRLVTGLFYFSNVSSGGATVFPVLGVAVPPQKGLALVWSNVRPGTLALHDDTLHAGCPILVGSKWIGTFWVHSLNQHHLCVCNVEKTKKVEQNS